MKTKSILFFLAFAFYVNTNIIHAQVNVQDSLALVDLYNSTDGPHWKHQDNWLTSNPISAWYGIKVTEARVTSIDLRSNKLKGSIPFSIGNLVNLEVLDLSNFSFAFFLNQLSGSIPSSIGNLVNLQKLDLSGNQLTDSIPASIGDLVKLTTLNLSFNQLTGSIPFSIGNLVKLTSLAFSINELTDSIPASIGNLVKLQDLSLGSNHLSNSIPSSIGNLVNLKILSLYSNQLSGSIPSSIGNLVKDSVLSLWSNQLSDSIPSSIGNLVNLTQLDLGGNQLTSSIPSSIGNLVNLQQLYLGGNQLTDTIPSSIGNLVNLSTLNLSSNQLSGSIPSSLGNLVNLDDLYLSYNQLSGSISPLSNRYFSSLDLSHNQLSDTIPYFVVWDYLDLRYNRFTFDGMERVANSVDYFSETYYSPQLNIPIHQKGDTMAVYAGGPLSHNIYKWFSIEQNNFVATVGDSVFHPLQFGNYFVTVKNVVCGLTLYTDTILYGTTDIRQDSLALVDLYNSTNGTNWKNHVNWLTASPLATWYGITVTNGRVTAISLQSNGLDGNIPFSIDYLQKLSILRLDGNELQGSIPATFGNLSHSLSVNLSDNHFTFTALEFIAQIFPNAVYAPQKSISLEQNGIVLFVSAGGTLKYNAYTWYSVDQRDSSTVASTCNPCYDTIFVVPSPGKYFAKITNSICTQLTLYSDTINFGATTDAQDSLVLVDLYNSANGANWSGKTNWLTSNPVSTWYGVTVTNRRVTKIDLHFNFLSDSLPSSIGNLTKLTDLNLELNGLTRIPSSIGNLANLTNLNLSRNESLTEVPSSMGNLSHLVTLNLEGDQLNKIPSSFGNLVNLQQLYLNGNQLSGSIPSSIGNLLNLQQLYLSGNQLSGSIPSSIGNLVNLQTLDLRYNQLSGNIPASIGNLVNLQQLNLFYNQLNGSIPSSISNLINLQTLDISNNQLSGNIPASIGKFVSLQQLNLGYNQLNGSVPSSIGDLANLQDLDLSVNQLSDSIPSIGNLVNLQTLILSNNQLSGNIPSSIGNLINLRHLWLSQNQLSGSIPASIGNLIVLTILTLNDNKLSGAIPASITNLDRVLFVYDEREGPIGFINLSNNRFTYNGMEAFTQKFGGYTASYSPQANIPIHQNGDTLYVSAGGALSRNTYRWFSVEQKNSVTIVGDSVFHPSQSGHYFASVNNAYCYDLTLYTDTIFYDATLPVTIINLKAQQQKSVIKIDWTSVTEINVAGYEIQRSSNALNFNTIGSLTAKGNGTQKVNYTFNDVQPLHGDNYYRIKAADKDGKIMYSNTVLVKMNNDKIITVVYPNPAKDILHVETNGSATFSLINQSGKILLTTNINGKEIINVSGVAAGLYYLKNNSTGNVQKVVIAR